MAARATHQVHTLADWRALPPDQRREVQRQVRIQRARDSGTMYDWCLAGPATELGPCRLYRWQRHLAGKLWDACRWAMERKQGKVVRIIMVSSMPQVGKSEIVSRRIPARAMAELGMSFAVCSYADTLARDHSRKTRAILRSPLAKALHPHLAAESRYDSSDREDDWTVPSPHPDRPGPRYIARGRKGALTGRMVDGIILDDMYKSVEDYASAANQRVVSDFIRTQVMARLMERGGLLVDMGTRWGTNDTKGFWADMAKEMQAAGLQVMIEDWTYPLRAREDDFMGREPGEYLTDAWDEDKERAARILYGPDAPAILDCDPPEATGGLYPPECLSHRYEGHPLQAAATCEAFALSVDAAETEGGGDHTVIQWWGIRGRDSLLLWQWRGQWGDTAVVREITQAIEWVQMRHPLSAVLVEDTSAGKVAIAALRQQLPQLQAVSAAGQGSKRDRIRGVRMLWSLGTVLLPGPSAHASWCYETDRDGRSLIDRLRRLRGERPDMRGEVDDEADAATIFLRWRMASWDAGAERPTRNDLHAALDVLEGAYL